MTEVDIKGFNRGPNRRAFMGMMGVAAGALALAGTIRSARAGTSIRYQNLWNTATDTHYKGMQYLYETFAQKYPDYQVQDIQIPTGELAKKNMADCAAGDCPEIMHDLNNAGDMWGPGYLLDITQHVTDDPSWKASFYEDALQFCSTDGHIWGLPAEITPMPTIWNTRLLEAAGLSEVPATLDAYVAAGEKLRSIGKNLFSVTRDSVQVLHNLVVGQEGGIEAMAATKFDAPQYANAFRIMKELIDAGLTPPNDIELTTAQANAMFVAEQNASMINGIWTLRNDLMGKSASPDLIDVVKFSGYPAVSSLGTVVENKVATMIGLSSALGNQPERLEEAVAFLKHWFTPEMATAWVTRTWSPIGVKVDMANVEGLDPLPRAFLGTIGTADRPFSLPPTKAMQERKWDDAKSAGQALMAGQSAEQAHQTYLTEMSKYFKA